MTNIVEAQGVSFQREDTTILHSVDAAIGPGERVALLGANGVGKSTLMRILAGAWEPSAGQVLLDAHPMRYHREGRNQARRRVQMVLQEPDEQLFATSVAADVSFGPCNLGLDQSEVRARVDEAMEATGITHLAERVPHQLSFGQRKRVALAGALAMRPALLLLDEPTAGLDPRGTAQLMEVLEQRSQLGTALLFSTHDVNVAVHLAQRIIVLVDGRAHSGGVSLLKDPEFVHRAGLALPWAPLVSDALGTTVTTPADLL